MKRLLSILFAAGAAVFPAAETQAAFPTSSGTVSAGMTLEANRIYAISSDTTLAADATKSAISLPANATNVIYVAKGVTLKVTGGAASGVTPAGAGIRVPTSSKLIITGEGTVL